VQFVHQHVNGMYTIVGAMVVEAAEDNGAWAPYIDAMTTPVGVEGVPATIDWPKLLPTYRAAYFYDGSLTTPPCTERVEWIFLTDPVELSAAQIGKMRVAYPDSARPLQTYGTYRSLTFDEPGL
jgi:carbonic anhydrase